MEAPTFGSFLEEPMKKANKKKVWTLGEEIREQTRLEIKELDRIKYSPKYVKTCSGCGGYRVCSCPNAKMW